MSSSLDDLDISPFDSEGLQYIWNASSIITAETCLRKYQYEVLEGWENPRKSVHLLFGGWYAQALERYYLLCAEGMSSNDALCEVVHDTLKATWFYEDIQTDLPDNLQDLPADIKKDLLDKRINPPKVGRPWQSDHNTKTRETLIRSIVWYVDHFEGEGITTVILAGGKPAVELRFSIDLDNGLLLIGKLDRLVNYGDEIYVMDQKTTGATITQRYFEGWSPDTQMSAYTFAGQALYKLPIKGVILDAAQIAVGFTRFERGFIFRSAAQLDEWYASALYHIEAARAATALGRFPMNHASCGNYVGCEFRAVCSRSPEVRGQFLKGDFVRKERQ